MDNTSQATGQGPATANPDDDQRQCRFCDDEISLNEANEWAATTYDAFAPEHCYGDPGFQKHEPVPTVEERAAKETAIVRQQAADTARALREIADIVEAHRNLPVGRPHVSFYLTFNDTAAVDEWASTLGEQPAGSGYSPTTYQACKTFGPVNFTVDTTVPKPSEEDIQAGLRLLAEKRAAGAQQDGGES